MTLYTKCVREKAKDSDVIGASIMRFNRPYYKFDMWIPALAPSEHLLGAYKRGKIDWEGYEERFREEVLEQTQDVINSLGYMALVNDVTLLCWEDLPKRCHRRLVAEECQKSVSKLQVVLH